MMYMRYVTSAQIKAEPMNYMPYLFNPDQPWLEDPMDPGDFCNLFVDPMGKEAGAHPSPLTKHTQCSRASQTKCRSSR